MKFTLSIVFLIFIVSCGRQPAEVHLIKLPDGTLSFDSKQGGTFEMIILPLDLNTSWEGNKLASQSSNIELVIDGSIKVKVSKSEVIRIQGLSNKRHSVTEYVDDYRTSSFHVSGKNSVVADYYEMYGNWMIREPLKKAR